VGYYHSSAAPTFKAKLIVTMDASPRWAPGPMVVLLPTAGAVGYRSFVGFANFEIAEATA
jgi:hypothetical protein